MARAAAAWRLATRPVLAHAAEAPARHSRAEGAGAPRFAWRAGPRVLVGALGALMLGAAAQAEIRLRDDRGATLRLAAPPQRIVSLLPSLTESLCVLGACERLIGTDRYSNWPARVLALPKLGGLEDPQLERIVALRPDVVVLAPSDRLVERLDALGVPMLVVDAKTHADVARSLALLASLIGTPAAAAPLQARLQSELAAAAARVPASLRGQRVYFEIDASPYGAGPGSFIGETLARLGLRNALPPELGPFPKLNPELVVRLQPELVMAEQHLLEAMPQRPGWGALRALQGGRVCGFPTARYELLIRPGPRLGEAAGLLADCLQGLGATALARPGNPGRAATP